MSSSQVSKRLVGSEVRFSYIFFDNFFSLIILNIGIALSFGVWLTFIMALLTIIHWIATSLKEEEALLQKFSDEYIQYKISVKWRMIPGIF